MFPLQQFMVVCDDLQNPNDLILSQHKSSLTKIISWKIREILTFALQAFFHYCYCALMAPLPSWAFSPAISQMNLHISTILYVSGEKVFKVHLQLKMCVFFLFLQIDITVLKEVHAVFETRRLFSHSLLKVFIGNRILRDERKASEIVEKPILV